MARTKSYPDDLRDQLIAAAYERLRHTSADQVSLRELAASVDTSTNAIYSIFGGKDPLMAEVVQAAKRDFIARQVSVVERGPSMDSFAESGRVYRRWARDHPFLYRLIFGGGAELGAGLGLADEALEPLRVMLTALMDASLVRHLELEGLCLSLWASTHGFVLLEMNLWPEGSPEADALYERHLAANVRGILTDEGLVLAQQSALIE